MRQRAFVTIALLLCCSVMVSAQDRLDHLRSWTGKYPTFRHGKFTKSFFRLPEIRQPLSRLLKTSDYILLTRNYKVETPIKQVSDFLVVKVCRAHNCSDEQAGFAINLKSGTIYVRMYADEMTRWFSSHGKYTDMPQDAQDYLNDFSAN